MCFSWRKLREEIVSTCANHSDVILMVSGGVDSMFLLDFVRRTGIEPLVFHFQHHIRPDDHREVFMIERVCRRLGLQLVTGHGSDLAGATNMESVAREQRWECVERLIRERNMATPIVLTAHHYDDQLEHFFLSATRGRKLESLVMKRLLRFDGYHKYKPFLELEKAIIYKQARRRGLEWVEDPTNLIADVAERNLFRNTIIPQMLGIRNIRRSMRNLMSDLEIRFNEKNHTPATD